MPVRFPNRRRETYSKITIQMGELTIVAEKPVEEGNGHRQQHHPKRRNSRAKQQSEAVRPDDSNINNPQAEHGEDPMLIDDQPEQREQELRSPSHEAVFVEYQDQRTPSATTNNFGMSKAPSTMSSPLKRKQQVTSSANLALHDQGDSSELKTARRGFQRRPSQEQGLSQKLSAASAEAQARKKRKRDVEVAQELMLVTLKRPLIEHRFENEDHEEREKEEDSEHDSTDRSSAESCSEGNENEEDADDEDSASNEKACDSADGAEVEKDIEEQEIQSHQMTKRLLDEMSFTESDDTSDIDTHVSENEEPSADATGREHYIVAPRTPKPHSAMDLQRVASQALAGLDPQSSAPGLARRSNHPTPQQENLSLRNGRAVMNPILEGSGGTRANRQRRHKSVLSYSSDPDSSWRPRVPEHSGMPMEVEEEIVDAGSPIRAQTRSRTTTRRLSSRRNSGIGSQPLTIVRSRPSSPSSNPLFTSLQDSQGSIILGEPPRAVRRPSEISIPETQFVDDPEVLETRFTFVPPPTGYFDQARRGLAESTPGLNPLTRTNSMPVQMHTIYRPSPLMVGHISMTQVFNHTLSRNPLTAGSASMSSPVRPASRLPTLMEETSDQMKSLKALTRQASLGWTVPESAKKRTVSLPFTPPFKK
jgi:hypothetical protein